MTEKSLSLDIKIVGKVRVSIRSNGRRYKKKNFLSPEKTLINARRIFLHNISEAYSVH